MNVYAITAHGEYCGGMAVVAAATEQEARALANLSRDSQTGLSIDYATPGSCAELLPCTYEGEPRLLAIHEEGE